MEITKKVIPKKGAAKIVTHKDKVFITTGPPELSLPPTTTAEENVVTAGQRRINLIWEVTQGLIAIMITSSVIYTSINKIESDVLTNAFFLIVSMYFVRTNHSFIGGVPKSNYSGR